MEGLFAKPPRRRLGLGVFSSAAELRQAILRFIGERNAAEARPFSRTTNSGKIIAARKEGSSFRINPLDWALKAQAGVSHPSQPSQARLAEIPDFCRVQKPERRTAAACPAQAPGPLRRAGSGRFSGAIAKPRAMNSRKLGIGQTSLPCPSDCSAPRAIR